MDNIIDFFEAKNEILKNNPDRGTHEMIDSIINNTETIPFDDEYEVDEQYFKAIMDNFGLQAMDDLFVPNIGQIINWNEPQRPIVPVDIYLEDGATAPIYAHGDEDSGADIFTYEEITVKPGTTAKVRTGVSFGIPKGFGIQIKGRSGINSKGIECTITDVYGHKRDGRGRITIREGTVDQGYTGEVYVIFDNITDETITIPKGSKIAQAIIFEIPMMSFVEVENKEDLGKTNRGSKGFGSTGIIVED